MRQHGSMQSGKQALSFAVLLAQKGGKHPVSSCALAWKLLATKGINRSSTRSYVYWNVWNILSVEEW